MMKDSFQSEQDRTFRPDAVATLETRPGFERCRIGPLRPIGAKKNGIRPTQRLYHFAMRMRFNEAKVTQAAAFLLKLRGGRMKYIKLLKLLYLADRQSLLKRGRTISTDRFVSMDDGPVLSITYNLIQGDYRNTQHVWSKTIVSAGDYDVTLKNPDAPLEIGQLSRAEIEILQAVFDEYGGWNRWRLIDKVMHKLPEWHDPNGSMIPIEIRDILQCSSLSTSEQVAIEEELEHLTITQNLLSAPAK